jgi:hypothetical protein
MATGPDIADDSGRRSQCPSFRSFISTGYASSRNCASPAKNARWSYAKLEANLGDVIGCKNTEGLPVVPTVLL